jgi:hypothetical protein
MYNIAKIKISEMLAQLKKMQYPNWWLSSQVNLKFDDCKIIVHGLKRKWQAA